MCKAAISSARRLAWWSHGKRECDSKWRGSRPSGFSGWWGTRTLEYKVQGVRGDWGCGIAGSEQFRGENDSAERCCLRNISAPHKPGNAIIDSDSSTERNEGSNQLQVRSLPDSPAQDRRHDCRTGRSSWPRHSEPLALRLHRDARPD